MKKLLIANRGEVAIRIARSAAELGLDTVSVFSEDDESSLHTRATDEALPLKGVGAAAYLDHRQVLAAAREAGADAIHPGYGFLSENAAFAQACAHQGVTFVGPDATTLALFGDKAAARSVAKGLGVPVMKGTAGGLGPSDVVQFLTSLGDGGAIMLKAVAGGGGRGMRVVSHPDEVVAAFERCQSEAVAAFGNDDLFAEEFFPRARHVEVQIVGDGSGAVSHLWDRECSVQRRRQKLIEIAPARGVPDSIRRKLFAHAVELAASVRYQNLGTMEFLVDALVEDRYAFIEANPRLQVEHTVTEEVTGLDLVRIQLEIAAGRSLKQLRLSQRLVPEPRGTAIEARINLETIAPDGSVRPTSGRLTVYEAPSGFGVRVDGYGYSGYQTSARYDSLLAKLIVHSPGEGLSDAAAKAYRALCEFRILGVQTNIPLLQSLLKNPALVDGRMHTRFIDEHGAELLSVEPHRRLFHEAAGEAALAGARIDAIDPLAVLDYGKNATSARVGPGESADLEDGARVVRAPLQGTVVTVMVNPGDHIVPGTALLVMDAMKMEHEIVADVGGVVQRVLVGAGVAVQQGAALIRIEESDVSGAAQRLTSELDLDEIRLTLSELFERRRQTKDEARPEAVARRRKTSQRTVRENIEDLCDPGSFVEYGSLVVAARLRVNTLDELMASSPADGLVTGLGQVNGALFDAERSRIIAMSYDYTVFAGTQGVRNHQKKDRMFELAGRWKLPVVFFTEGGGGRPGDTDASGVAGLKLPTFLEFGRLSGLVPLVGITSGRCFAGNAVLLGCCDVIIATENSTMGMGGPALIEGGGLGVFHPDEVGPISVQAPNGVIDVVVKDEAEAVRVAKQYLSYFQGTTTGWSCADQRLLRRAVPENRLRVYDIRTLIESLFDSGSVLELRRHFGAGMVTALARIEGRPVGVLANNPKHLGGAIDRDGSDKAARFMQLCNAFDLPIVVLCDTPGNMVGPEAEKTAIIRHNCRLFVIGANLSVPLFTVVLRKSYGLGAMAMSGSSLAAPFFVVSWPTGEFGGMGLEGAVKLGYRNELAAIEDPAARKARYDQLVAEAYDRGKALRAAAIFEFDEVIDPAETRAWIVAGLRSVPAPARRETKKSPWIDTW